MMLGGGQKPPEASILLTEASIFPSGGSNGRGSEPFSVIPRLPLCPLRQDSFEEFLYPRKHHGDLCRESAFRGQSVKRDLPICRRRDQTRRQIVRSSPLEGQTQCVHNPLFIQSARSNQESDVYQVLHSAVRRIPRERVSVN